MLLELNDSDRDLLAAYRAGTGLLAYAREHHYTRSWAKWKSRTIRAKLGAATLEEAARMADEPNGGGMTAEDRAELKALREDLKEAQRALRAASTPRQEREARDDIQDAEDEIDRLARRTGISREDIEKVQKEKRYAEFQEHSSRYEAERKEREDEERRKNAAKRRRREASKDDADDDDDGPDEEAAEEKVHWTERPLFGGKKR